MVTARLSIEGTHQKPGNGLSGRRSRFGNAASGAGSAASGHLTHQGNDRHRCSPVTRLGATRSARARAGYRSDGRCIGHGARCRRPKALRLAAGGGAETPCLRWYLSTIAMVSAFLFEPKYDDSHIKVAKRTTLHRPDGAASPRPIS